MDTAAARVGVVAIGRNEARRLQGCLDSLRMSGWPVVYVDSLSTDDSVAVARSCGADVVEMDRACEPSAARARNLGVARLVSRFSGLEFVGFIDGDCIARPAFLDAAVAALMDDPGVVAVCGYRVEERPGRNVFHRVAQLEWQMGPIGDIDEFGGDVVIRVAALSDVGGYDDRLVAWEDPELSHRLRAAGGRLRRLDVVSTVHDIDMTSTRQWWNRSRRAGYGAAAAAGIARAGRARFASYAARGVLWGVVAPLCAIGMTRGGRRWPLALLAGRFALSAVRAASSIGDARGATAVDRAAWGASCSLSAIPVGVGSLQCLLARLRGRGDSLVEYRDAHDNFVENG